MNLSLYARTQGILHRYNLRPRKRLSQHFLINDQTLSQIVEAAKIRNGELVLEIGSGLGLLTEALAEKGARVTALEIDQNFCGILQERFKDDPGISVVCQDILKFEPQENFSGKIYKVIGNLPYHISGSILRWFIDRRQYFSIFYLMLQKEVAERVVADPGSKRYGILSLMCQYFADSQILFSIPPRAFLPPPKVESVFLGLLPRAGDWIPNRFFVPLVKQSFSQRRKTLLNNLKSWKPIAGLDWNELILSAGIEPKVRAENVSLHRFVRLAEELTRRTAQS